MGACECVCSLSTSVQSLHPHRVPRIGGKRMSWSEYRRWHRWQTELSEGRKARVCILSYHYPVEWSGWWLWGKGGGRLSTTKYCEEWSTTSVHMVRLNVRVCVWGGVVFPGAWVDVKQLLSSHILYRFMWEQDKTGPDVETGTLKGCLDKIKKNS